MSSNEPDQELNQQEFNYHGFTKKAAFLQPAAKHYPWYKLLLGSLLKDGVTSVDPSASPGNDIQAAGGFNKEPPGAGGRAGAGARSALALSIA